MSLALLNAWKNAADVGVKYQNLAGIHEKQADGTWLLTKPWGGKINGVSIDWIIFDEVSDFDPNVLDTVEPKEGA